MTQSVSQVSAEQAYVGQTGRKSTQDSGEFRSLIRSAVKSGDETGSKPESGPDAAERRDDGGKDQPGELLHNAAQTIVFPFGTDFSAVIQNTPAGDSAAAETLFSVTNAAAVSDMATENTPALSADLPVPGEASQADTAKPVSGTETAQVRAVPEQPKEGFASSQALSDSTAVSAVQQEGTAPTQAAPERTASGAQEPADEESFRSRTGEISPETGADSPVSEHAELSDVNISTEKVSQEDKAESGTVGETVRPLKKAEASENSAPQGTLSDLYAGGNVVIKISDAKAAQKPSAARQVAQTVAQQMRQGKQEFQVELYPQSLGKVSVRLSSENGILTVEIAAANPKTQSMLLSGSEDIRSLLQNTTGQNVTVVQPEQPGGWYNRQDGGNSGSQQQGQDEEKQKKSAAGQGIQNIGAGGMSTGSFLSIMRGLA